jgi:hypothetical protein
MTTAQKTHGYQGVYQARVAQYEVNPYAYVSSSSEGIVWYCGHRHRSENAAWACLPKAKKAAAEMNSEVSA